MPEDTTLSHLFDLAIKLERSPDNSNWTTISSALAPTTTSYTDSGLSQPAYYYRLTATVSSNASPTVLVQSSGMLAQAPAYLTATLGDTNRILLTWLDVAANETAYSVERSPNGSSNWSVLTVGLPPNTQSYLDQAPPVATNYYRVRCQASGGAWGAYSAIVRGTCVLPPPPPTIAIAGLSNNQPMLLVEGAVGFTYTFEGSTNLLDWDNLYSTVPSASPFGWTDTNATSYAQRFYRVLRSP